MLKRIVYILLLFISSVSQSAAQNLVLNSSFEEYYSCPVFYQGNIDTCKYWFQPLNISTSDWYNECAMWAANGGMGVPHNIFGYQTARTGSGYAGVGCSNKPFPGWINRREYIETHLQNPLVSNKVYCVSFYVSLADSSTISVNSIGAYLTPDSVLSNIPSDQQPLLQFNAQVENPASLQLNDALNWTKISGSFTALGGEQFLTLGCFRPDYELNIVNFNGNKIYKHSYYYIDDVSVYSCDAPISEANAGDNTAVCKGNVFMLNAQYKPQYKYTWLTINGDTLSDSAMYAVTINSDTAFVLRQVDFKFDISTDTIHIKLKNCSSITLPNAFTPNADGVNDVFRPKETNFKSIDAQIINRWGNKIYSWNKTDGYWNGKTKDGTICSSGTYFYVITVSYEDGNMETKTGSVTLTNGER